MQLIMTLLIVVAVLTILTGVAVLFGATKRSRVQGMWFFIATLGAAVWSVAIAIFMTLPEASAELIPWLSVGIITGIMLTDVAMIGYTSWGSESSGKVLTMLFAAAGAGLIGLLVVDPHLFYSKVDFGADYNRMEIVHGWFFYAMIAYFTIISIMYSGALSKTIKKIKNLGAKNGLRIFQVGLSIGGILALVFDLILITDRPDLIWIGPMAVSITIIAFYYSVVRYRILALSGKWMEIWSYITLVAMGLVVYMLIFYVVFTAIFRIPNPSSGVLILNFVMLAIVLCMIPAIIELASMIRSYLPTRQIDTGYIVKKLSRLTKGNVDLKELASFLAMTLKFDYVGIYVNGRLYESRPMRISGDDLVKVGAMKSVAGEIWGDEAKVAELSERVERVAVLFDPKGKVVAQILFGRQVSRRGLDRRDLIQIEMVMKLVSVIIGGDY